MKTAPAPLSPALFALGTLAALPAAAQTPVATYQFNSTLSADQGGVAALTAVNPLGTSAFTTATVFGKTRTVYTTSADSAPADQSGFTLNTAGLITNPGTYSLQDVFSFNTTNTGYRRILSVDGRVSDAGLYALGTDLNLYPTGGGNTSVFANNTFEDLVLTVADTGGGLGTVNGYLNGVLDFTTTSTNLANITANPLAFYLDNNQGGAQTEYANSSTALVQLYNQTLTASQVAAIDGVFPRVPTGAVPEAPAGALLGLGLLPVAVLAARRRKVTP